MTSRGVFSRTALVFGLVFLYVPILSMIVFSFNNSRLVTVWDAAHSPTLKWYGELISNGQIVGAAWLSIRIALVSATGAVAEIHDRMPLVLEQADWPLWLGEEPGDPTHLLRPSENGVLICRPRRRRQRGR